VEELKVIPINQIKVGEHAQRVEEDDPDTEDLAASIRRLGVINPLRVAVVQGEIHLVAGHRRLAAAKMADLVEVPCIVRESNLEIDSEITFAENFFRKDLSPIELACAIKDVLDKETQTVAQLAAGFHKSEHWVRSMVALAQWPNDVQAAVHDRVISVSAASNLALVTDVDYRMFLLRNAAESGATARTTSAWLQAWRAMQPPEEAIQAEPVQAGPQQVPMIPMAPCLCCAQQFEVNMMSHVPVCGACIQIIRKIGVS